VLRAVLVVALVTAASLALQGRHGLDWAALSDPVQIRWARVLAGSVLLLVLGVAGRSLLRRLRRPKPRVRPTADRVEPEGEPFPWLLRLLAALLVAAAVAAAWFVADALSGATPELAPPAPDQQGGDPSPQRPQVTWWTLAEVAGVLLVVAAVARLVAARGARPAPEKPGTGDEPVTAVLTAAVDAAEERLLGPGDARAAIVAAYAAMAASISAGLARRGGPASASDTPTELLARAVSAGLVRPGPAADLTSLFREARFSRHPMGEAERRSAERALAGVRDEPAARRG
jgi:hypothetical protein